MNVFMNLSNHPSDTWSAEQTSAALSFASEIRDVKFPIVEPNAQTKDLIELCLHVLSDVPAGTRTAMVQGESTLSYLLVGELRKRGIRCLAATTRRQVEIDSQGLKLSRFCFIAFREYPNLLPSIVHPNYKDQDHAARGKKQAVDIGLKKGSLDRLVLIPSNPDLLPACLLFLEPKRTIVLNTHKNCIENIRLAHEWFLTKGALPPKGRWEKLVEVVGEDEPLDYLEILANLESLPRVNTEAFLITGGTSPHAALLARYAMLKGSLVLHLGGEYIGQTVTPGTGMFQILKEIDELKRGNALRDARRLLREGAFDGASRALDGVRDTPDSIVALTREWIACWRLRDAMRFEDAAQRAEDILQVSVARIHQTPEFTAIRSVAEKQKDICLQLSSCNDVSKWPHAERVPIIFEVLTRADQERKRGRTNHAALLYYRVLELLLAERLRVAWGIKSSSGLGDTLPRISPEGTLPPENWDALKSAWSARSDESVDALFRPLSLQVSMTLLFALGDPALIGKDTVLGQIRNLGSARNSSIFAHGFSAVDETRLTDLAALAGGQIDPKEVDRPSLMVLLGLDAREVRKALRHRLGPHLADSGNRVLV